MILLPAASMKAVEWSRGQCVAQNQTLPIGMFVVPEFIEMKNNKSVTPGYTR